MLFIHQKISARTFHWFGWEHGLSWKISKIRSTLVFVHTQTGTAFPKKRFCFYCDGQALLNNELFRHFSVCLCRILRVCIFNLLPFTLGLIFHYIIRIKDITPRWRNEDEKLKSIWFVAIVHPRIAVKLKPASPSSFRVWACQKWQNTHGDMWRPR